MISRDRVVALATAAVALAVLAVPLALVGGSGSATVPTAALVSPAPAPSPVVSPARSAAPSPASARRTTGKPLAGLTIALDPGHQLGNHHFPRQISRQVPAGGFTKPCNTTGTSTNGGYPEATFNFAVAKLVQRRLDALGATVRLTRASNSQSRWGPCVDARGRFGATVGAALTVSLHADGARSGARGFHVITPTSRKGWTDDIASASLRLAKALRAGLDTRGVRRSTYVGGGTALSIRSDLGTLNLSDVPVAMLELGNMRNAKDARLMRSAKGRGVYASAVVLGIRRYLGR